MKLNAFRCAIFLVLCAALPMAGAAEQPQAYTNSDLRQYRNSSDGTQKSVAAPKEKSASAKKMSDEREKEYWCREGMKRTKRVEKAQARVKEAEAAVSKKQEAADRHQGDRKAAKRLSDAQKKLAKCQKALAKEEAERAALENRAHRKGVLPGWLKCNTEF